MDNKTNLIPLYVLNNFLKFDRKIYQIFGLELGRPVSIKIVIYSIVFGIAELILYFTPVFGKLINWLPFAALVVIPILLGWLLADVGTEGRSPVYFFRSFLSYQYRKFFTKRGYFRGRTIPAASEYQFRNYVLINVPKDEIIIDKTSHNELTETKKSKREELEVEVNVSNPDNVLNLLKNDLTNETVVNEEINKISKPTLDENDIVANEKDENVGLKLNEINEDVVALNTLPPCFEDQKDNVAKPTSKTLLTDAVEEVMRSEDESLIERPNEQLTIAEGVKGEEIVSVKAEERIEKSANMPKLHVIAKPKNESKVIKQKVKEEIPMNNNKDKVTAWKYFVMFMRYRSRNKSKRKAR